jgi:hypothetical protein
MEYSALGTTVFFVNACSPHFANLKFDRVSKSMFTFGRKPAFSVMMSPIEYQ